MLLKTIAPLGVVCLLAACGIVGPDFKRPSMPMAGAFAFAPQQALRQAAEDHWWTAYNEPLLNELVNEAMNQNLDLERAVSRIQAARALQGTVGRNAQITGSATAQFPVGNIDAGGRKINPSAGFQPAFIVDLFGGQRRASDAAKAQVASVEFDRAATRLAVQLELVETYLDLRAQGAMLAEQKSSIRTRERIVFVLRARYKEGDTTLIDLRRAEAELATLQANVPSLIAARKLAGLRISTLLATPMQDLLPRLENTKGQPAPRNGVYAGVPAALLRNRPDIRRAEADFAVAVAEIGVQEAQLYPSLRINGNLRAATVSSVTLGPVLTFPLLDLPARRARVASARARAAEAQTVWRQTVLSAIEEVQVALVSLESTNDRLTRLGESARAYRSAERLVTEAFEIGEATVGQVLDTQENGGSVRADIIRTRSAYGQAWAQLNVAVGQGWLQTNDAQ